MKLKFWFFLSLASILAFLSCTTPPSNSLNFDTGKADWSQYVQPINRNFTTLGFVSIEATLIGRYDSYGNVYWSGNDVTYYRLIEEAKKLNADAVINIVIDTEETIMTDNESSAALVSKGNGRKMYTRKRTATGLAIRYIN